MQPSIPLSNGHRNPGQLLLRRPLRSRRRPQVSPEVSAGAIRLTTGRYLGAEDAKAAVAALVAAIGPRDQVMHNNKMTSLILLIIYQSEKIVFLNERKGCVEMVYIKL